MVHDTRFSVSPMFRGRRPALPLSAGLFFTILLLVALIILPPLMHTHGEALRSHFTEDVLALNNTLGAIEHDVQELQAALRGYILTQEPGFLAQYREAETALTAHLQLVGQLVPRVDPAMEVQARQLVATFARWQGEVGERQVALVQEGRTEVAVQELVSAQSQELFAALRQPIQQLRGQTQQIGDDLLAAINRWRITQGLLTSGLAALGLLAGGVVIIGYRRIVTLMRELQDEREQTARLAEQAHTRLLEAERRNQQLTLLNAVELAASTHVQLAERADAVLMAITDHLAITNGAIWVFGHETGPAPLVVHGFGGSDVALPVIGPEIIGWLQQDRAPFSLTAAELPSLPAAVQAFGTKLAATFASTLVLPLRGRTESMGALLLAAEQPACFADDDQAFWLTLANTVGLALDNALLYAIAQTQRRRLQAIFDHSPEGILFVEGPPGQQLLVNPAAEALLGPPMPGQDLCAYLAGRPCYHPGGERRSCESLPLVRTLVGHEASLAEELIVEQPDGQRAPVLMTSIPLRDADGVVRGAMAVIQDLRRLREVERLKAEFIALVSHELRTPLTAIQGCAQMLLASESTAEREHALLQIIAEQGEQLQELIDNLLNLSQVEAGTLPVRRAPVVLERLVQDVLRKLRSSASDLLVQTELDAHLPLIFVDPRRIEQVLLNLLDNARKFSPPGSLITLRARPAGAEVLLSVSDEGPGIPPAERERVFERFYQVDRPGRRLASGTGLGLTICRALVEAHGGRIWVEAAPGGGTTVCLTLPMATALEPAVLPTSSSHLIRRRTDAVDVLVVDDDPALRRLLERGLSEAGYRVETVAEPEAALEAVTHRPPDLILLDLMLPGMDGFTLCQRLREWTRVPIVILTVRASEKDIVTGLQLGADDYVTKPFRTSELLARIEAVLRRTQPDATADGPACVKVGGLSVDLAQRQVTVDGCEVALTPTEYRLLAFLARYAGRVLTHEQILQAVWGPEYRQENHYLWAHVTHLRQKIEADSKRPRYLLTERGVGYRLAGDGASQPAARAGQAGMQSDP